MWPGRRVDRNGSHLLGRLQSALHYQYYNDGGRYNPQTNSWTKTSLPSAPSPRASRKGSGPGRKCCCGAELMIPAAAATIPPPTPGRSTTLVNAPVGALGGRWSTVWTGNQMIIWGGTLRRSRAASTAPRARQRCAGGLQ